MPPPLAVPQLAYRRNARLLRLLRARLAALAGSTPSTLRGEASPPGAQPLPRVLERAVGLGLGLALAVDLPRP